jgi:4-hydroxy-4-methyl-2-oxoglutarate aldolase
VVIPAADVARTLQSADARVAAEQRALDALRAGATTLELYGLPGEAHRAEPHG